VPQRSPVGSADRPHPDLVAADEAGGVDDTGVMVAEQERGDGLLEQVHGAAVEQAGQPDAAVEEVDVDGEGRTGSGI
jgi:hypothetical protein